MQSELARLALSADQQISLRAFAEREFAASALGLIGLDVSREQIERCQKALETEPKPKSEPERKIQSALASIRILQSAVDQGAPLTPDLLLRLHDPFRGAADAKDDPDSTSSKTVNETSAVTARINAFCEWTAADSFRELNALEQAAIIVLRLLEIRPFEEGNLAAAIGAASLFTIRAGWPPIIISELLRPRFNPAVGEGLKMNTRPLVDLLAESLYESLDSWIRFVKQSRS